MNKIAIDIVLIPDDETLKICKEINKNLTSEIDFNNTWKIPHISLLMWVMNQNDLKEISDIVSRIWKNSLPISLNWTIQNHFSQSRQMNILSMKIAHNKTIWDIVFDLQQKVEPLLEYEDVSKDMFFWDIIVRDSSIGWVKWFDKKALQDRGEHITLGIWNAQDYVWKEYVWLSNRIAIYHLSDNCTCDHKLFEFRL